MEYQYHELSYMKTSFEHTQVKEDIENLLRKRHIIDQKLESKTREQNELYEKCMRHMRVLRKKGMTGDFYCPKKKGITATPTKVFDGGYAPNYIPSYRNYTPSKVQTVTNPAQGSFWSPAQSGHFTQSNILPSGGLLQNYPPGTPSSQCNQSIGQLTIAQPPKVPCSFGTFKSNLTDAEMMEYVNQNSKDESKDNASSNYNNEKSSSSKQNDQVHKGSPKKSKSDDESSSELNAEQALEYVSQDSENESKNEASTTDNSQKGCSSKHNDQAYEGSPKKTRSDGCKSTDVKEGKKMAKVMKNLHLLMKRVIFQAWNRKKVT